MAELNRKQAQDRFGSGAHLDYDQLQNVAGVLKIKKNLRRDRLVIEIRTKLGALADDATMTGIDDSMIPAAPPLPPPQPLKFKKFKLPELERGKEVAVELLFLNAEGTVTLIIAKKPTWVKVSKKNPKIKVTVPEAWGEDTVPFKFKATDAKGKTAIQTLTFDVKTNAPAPKAKIPNQISEKFAKYGKWIAAAIFGIIAVAFLIGFIGSVINNTMNVAAFILFFISLIGTVISLMWRTS